jgi:hypothetical protein
MYIYIYIHILKTSQDSKVSSAPPPAPVIGVSFVEEIELFSEEESEILCASLKSSGRANGLYVSKY